MTDSELIWFAIGVACITAIVFLRYELLVTPANVGDRLATLSKRLKATANRLRAINKRRDG